MADDKKSKEEKPDKKHAKGEGPVTPKPEGEKKPKKGDRKSTRLNSSHANISYAVFCLKKKRAAGGAAPRHRRLLCPRRQAAGPPEIDALSLHDALPIFRQAERRADRSVRIANGRRQKEQRREAGQEARQGRRSGHAQAGRREEAEEGRSEEHTSELQSRQYLVCRLLLEKKKGSRGRSPAPPPPSMSTSAGRGPPRDRRSFPTRRSSDLSPSGAARRSISKDRKWQTTKRAKKRSRTRSTPRAKVRSRPSRKARRSRRREIGRAHV